MVPTSGSFLNADLIGSVLVNGDLVEGDLVEGDLTEGDLIEGDLIEGNLIEGNLLETDVTDGNLINSDLINSDLIEGGLTDGGLADGGLADGGLADGGLADGGLANRFRRRRSRHSGARPRAQTARVKTAGTQTAWGHVLLHVVFRGIILGRLFFTHLVSRMARRLRRALLTLPSLGGWLDTATLTLLFGCIALVVGFGAGWLELPMPDEISREALSPRAIAAGFLPENWLRGAAIAFFVPALAAELLFRALPIPRREERLPLWRKWAWATISLGAFVACYPLGAHYLWPQAQTVVMQPSFLVLVALLGWACTVLYRRTGSVWGAVTLHWLAVLGWQLLGNA